MHDPPICSCGVTALPAEAGASGETFVCENPDCEAFGTVIPTPAESDRDFT